MKSFICPHCCPYRSIRESDPEPYFTLVEYNNKSEIAEMDIMKTKMKSQLSELPNFHSGVFDILAQLKEIPAEEIIRNKPSDNIKRGNTSSKVTDADIMKEIEENSKRMRGKARKEGMVSDRNGGFTIEIEGDDTTGGDTVLTEPPAKKQKSMPFFIGGSRVYGRGDTSELLEDSNYLNKGIDADDQSGSTHVDSGVSNIGNVGPAEKRYRFGQAPQPGPISVVHHVPEIMAASAGSISNIISGNMSTGSRPVAYPMEKAPTTVLANNQTEEEELQDLADIEWEE